MNASRENKQITKPELWVLHNMPRSGGTLVSKCFATMNSVILLSEIHPDAQHALSFNALRQAQQWHNLLPELNWQETSFLEAIKQIQAAVSLQRKQLVLRDWSHVDYLGPPVTSEPTLTPALIEALSNDFDLKTIQLVRHPLDAWLSVRRLTLIKKHGIGIDCFFKAYRLYLQKTQATHRLRYEDFLSAPSQQLSQTCGAVNLRFDAGYQDRWFDYDKVTGDTSNQGSLRKTPEISLRPRRQCDDISEQWLSQQSDYQYIVESIYSD